MLQPEISEKEQSITPMLRLAFRPFFILPALLSIVAVALWVAVLRGDIYWQASIAANIWHGHEMIFGFAATVAMGFLLTAAQTWTGVRSINGWKLGLVVVFWLLARFCFLSSSELLFIMGIICEAGWFLICTSYLTYMVVKSNNRRNFIFVPVLSFIFILDMASLLSTYGGNDRLSSHFSYSAVFLMSTIVTIVGGRVIPFFTTNALKLTTIKGYELLEKIIVIMMLCSFVVFQLSYFTSSPLLFAGTFIITGCQQILRMINWQTKHTLSTPLLWSLHLSYLNMGVGFVLLGSSYIDDSISFSSAIHMITVGSIGSMILAMMSRVSLGHTGRVLKVNNWIAISFSLILISALCRLLLPLIGYLMQGYTIAAICWVSGFAIFIFNYGPILTRARPDGRSG